MLPTRPRSSVALDVQLLHGAALDDGDARFLRRPVDEDVLHRRSAGLRPFCSGPDVDARPFEQRGRLVQRQTHDTGVAAVDALDPGRGRALDRVRAGLAERLAAGDVALDRVARERARSGRARRWSASRVRAARGDRDRADDAMTCGRRAARACARASAASAGLPRMRRPSATVVSAQRIGAGARPRARTPRDAPRAAWRASRARRRRAAARRGGVASSDSTSSSASASSSS